MAENLNYRYLGPTAKLDSSSFCQNDAPTNCETYGRLYLWSAAMDSAGIIDGNTANGCGYLGSECTLSEPVRGVCPKGWHLPSEEEWVTLIVAVDGDSSRILVDGTSWSAVSKLRSASGWAKVCGRAGCDDYNGTDSFGFSALPAGSTEYPHSYISAYFWSSTKNKFGKRAYALSLFANNAILNGVDMYEGLSVRCLKD
jgi:uncharacterized protein (TIGR02145 family)